MLFRMANRESSRSRELEQVRALLFPHLSREDGWRRIDAAFERAADGARADRIDELAKGPNLDEHLLRRLLRLGENGAT